MEHAEHKNSHLDTAPRRLGLALCLLLTAGFLTATSASASYEQVADFGKNEQLRATGLAVNTTGTGGVPAGTVYAVGSAGRRVIRYSRTGELREAWGWGVGNSQNEFQRCGPDGESAYPTCALINLSAPRGEGSGQFNAPMGVAVEQSTGRVYVLDLARKNGVIQVFSADGSELLASFGEHGASGESFDEGPGKIHTINRLGSIAVSNGGVVYVADAKAPSAASGAEERVMVFEAGVYAGRDHDIAPFPQGPNYIPIGLATDNAGNLYTHSEDAIYEFSPADRLTPVCEFQFTAGGIQSVTVDPATGAPFFYSSKGKKEIHQLSPCNPEGEFEEVGTIPFNPKPGAGEILPLAFNPALSYEEGRPPGVLYAADGTDRPEERGIGHIFAQPVSKVPEIESQSVLGVGESSALLKAEINPNGENTTYVFQYLTEAAYEANEPGDRFGGASEAPVGGASLGGGLATLPASVPVSGLEPGTAYRFRVVATNIEGTAEGEAKSFRTYPTTPSGLSDGRAYELVTPAEKHGGEPFPLYPELGSCGTECKPGALSEVFPRQISADGEAIVYSGSAFSLGEGASVYNEYLSKRTNTGWRTTNLSPALMGSNDQGYRAFNADLSEGVLYQGLPTLSPSAPANYANLYRQPSANPGALSPLLASAPPNRPEGPFFSIAYAGASKDFSRHFFAANDALEGSVPSALDGGATKNNLYEYDGATLRLVNVLPDETTVPGAFFGSKNQAQGETSNLSHAISDDGSRVFWSSESGQVYVRKDGTSTEEIPDASGKFLTASADGSKVLLTNGLLYDVEDLAAPPIDLSESEGGFLGITGQSEDLSKIYFVDTAVLDEAPNDQGAVAQAGQANLYAWEEGGVARYVATLAHTVGADDNPGGGATSGTWTASPANRLAQASPDGRWLAFRSKAALIDGFENVGLCELAGESPPVFKTSACKQVYLYDSATEELICPSCNPSGEAPHGPSTLPLLSPVPGELDPQPQPRYLSNAGRLYFDSQDALTIRDTNENVEDIYQYEPQGIGDCKRERGCVSLISAGREPYDSNFLAADPAGKNAFFTTRDQLVLEDRDKLVDVYVAREGGGFPNTAQSGGGECQGEACQPSPIVPAYPTPASGFTGAGNLKQGGPTNKRCPKPKRKVRRKGKTRCVNANRKRQGKKAQARHNQGGGR